MRPIQKVVLELLEKTVNEAEIRHQPSHPQGHNPTSTYELINNPKFGNMGMLYVINRVTLEQRGMLHYEFQDQYWSIEERTQLSLTETTTLKGGLKVSASNHETKKAVEEIVKWIKEKCGGPGDAQP